MSMGDCNISSESAKTTWISKSVTIRDGNYFLYTFFLGWMNGAQTSTAQ